MPSRCRGIGMKVRVELEVGGTALHDDAALAAGLGRVAAQPAPVEAEHRAHEDQPTLARRALALAPLALVAACTGSIATTAADAPTGTSADAMTARDAPADADAALRRDGPLGA